MLSGVLFRDRSILCWDEWTGASILLTRGTGSRAEACGCWNSRCSGDEECSSVLALDEHGRNQFRGPIGRPASWIGRKARRECLCAPPFQKGRARSAGRPLTDFFRRRLFIWVGRLWAVPTCANSVGRRFAGSSPCLERVDVHCRTGGPQSHPPYGRRSAFFISATIGPSSGFRVCRIY